MAIDIKSSIDIFIALCAAGGIIYRIARVESAIYSTMDKIEDGLREELRQLQKDFLIHSKDYSIKKEWQDSVIHQLDGKIDHKFNRLYQNQKDIQRYLEKSGFKTRQFGEENPES